MCDLGTKEVREETILDQLVTERTINRYRTNQLTRMKETPGTWKIILLTDRSHNRAKQ